MTKNVSHKNTWISGVTQAHVVPPPTPPIKIKHGSNSDKYFINLKFHGYPTSDSSEFYEFKMALFDNGNPKEFLLFVINFNIALAASGMLATGAKSQYLHNLVNG